MKGDIIVYLKDGRQFDISDLSPADAVAELKLRGCTTDDIKRTVHRVRLPSDHPQGAKA